MSFLQQLETEQPSLTLEETLAFLDAFDYGSDAASGSAGSSNGGGSPPFDDTDTISSLDDDYGADSTTTTVGSGSERSYSDHDDYFLSTLLSLPPESGVAPVTPPQTLPAGSSSGASATNIEPSNAPAKSLQRVKRKAAASSPKAESAKTVPKAPPTAGDATGTVKRRARKMPKTEILRLRDEVEELQARLTQLQKAGGSTASALIANRSSSASSTPATLTGSAQAPPPPPPSSSSTTLSRTSASWLDSAVEQFKALQKAEALNKKLKTEVSRQARLGNALKSMFSKKTAQQDMTFVAELEPAKPVSGLATMCALGAWKPLARNAGNHEADTLYESIERMQIETDSVQRAITAESDSDAVFSSSKTKLHAEFGPVFELKTNTPIKHPSFHHVALVFWNRAVSSAAEMHAAETAAGVTPSSPLEATSSRSFERPVALRFRNAKGDIISLNGVSIMGRQDDADRTVFTFAATLAVAGGSALVFREHGWMIVAPHASDSAQSVMQTFYRLDSEKRRIKAPSSSEAAAPFTPELNASELELRDLGMKALSENMRVFQSEVQSTLLNQGKGFDSSTIPRTCPLQNIKAILQV